MTIGVVDYQAGNLKSVETALRFLGADFFISQNPLKLLSAQKLIFPGVGEAHTAMQVLKKTGIDKALISFFKSGKPVLGICLGSQVILESSEERNTECLGIVKGRVYCFNRKKGFKVPHMGWNQVFHYMRHALFRDIADGASFYFVHSFYPDPRPREVVIAETDYIKTFTSGLALDNLVAVQFHPEKSGKQGLKFLDNFINWKC